MENYHFPQDQEDIFTDILMQFLLTVVIHGFVPRAQVVDIHNILIIKDQNSGHIAMLRSFTVVRRIAYSAKINGCETVITFYKKASKFDLFEFAK